MAHVYKLERLTYLEVDSLPRDNTIIILPMGPLESHGPHLPLAVDIWGGVVLAELGAEIIAKKGINVAIAPVLPYTLADVAMPFTGTVTLSRETVISVIIDIARSFSRHGFNKMVINCHHLERPNLAALNEAAEKVEEFGCSLLVSNAILDSIPKTLNLMKGEHPELDFHAGEAETSFFLWMFPDLVKKDFKQLPPVWSNIRQKFQEGAKDFKEAGAPMCYLGDPAKGTAALGQKLYQYQAQTLAGEVEEWFKIKRLK